MSQDFSEIVWKGRRGDTHAVEWLITALKDEKWDVRRAAARALIQIGRFAVQSLMIALKDPDVSLRRVAAWTLGEIGDLRAVESLIAALEDEDRLVYLIAASALEKIGIPAVRPLTDAVRDMSKAAATSQVRVGDGVAERKLVGDEETTPLFPGPAKPSGSQAPAKAPSPLGEDIPAWLEGEEMPSGEEALAWLEQLTAGKEEELRAQAEAETEARLAEIMGRRTPAEALAEEAPPEEAVAPPVEAPAAPPLEAPAAPPAEVPEWLWEIAPPESAPPEEAVPPTFEAPAAEAAPAPSPSPAKVPEWLAGLREGELEEEVTGGEVPEWLAGLGIEAIGEEEAEPAAAEAPAPAPAEVSEWLREIAPAAASPSSRPQPTIPRYSCVSFPSHSVVNHTEVLRVAVTLKPPTDHATRLDLEPPLDSAESVRVDACVIVCPLDFDLQSPNVQTIEVPLDTDSAPVIFRLVPKSVGRKTIGVEFFQNTRYLGRAEVETTVKKRKWFSRTVAAQSDLALRAHQSAPDLTIYIEKIPLRNEGGRYRFLLLSPIHGLDLNFEEVGEIELQTAPEVYFEEIFAELDKWLREGSSDDRVFFRRLTGLGANLYDQLFPDKLKRIYWEKLRGRVETVQIISADPWIPWELVRPYHPDTLEEDNFLCEQFALARWLVGPSSPDVIDFQRLALVVATANLPSTAEEAEALRQLPGVQVEDVPASLLDVYDLLETGGFNGLHFACHGEYDRRNPDQSVVLLEGGQRFRPNDIAGRKRTFGRDEPLVFLNACETGRAGFSLTGLGGWARAFIHAGAGGFVGSTWEACDESACNFAVAFYRHLLEGKTVAEATRLARRSIRRAGDPTWLSYTVYANPLARLETRPQTTDQVRS